MKAILTFLLFCTLSASFAQYKRLPRKEFSEKWKADSLGKNGFREQAFYWDSIHRRYVVNGINIRHYSKKKILRLLGKPSYYSKYTETYCLIGGFFSCWWEVEKNRQMMFYPVYDRSVPGHSMTGSLQITLRRFKQGCMYLEPFNLDYIARDKKIVN